MKIEINIEKKYFVILSGIVILIVGLLGAIAHDYNSSIPNPGHGGESVWVKDSLGNEKTLQEAIDDRSVGAQGYPGATGATGATGAVKGCRFCDSCGGGYSEVGRIGSQVNKHYQGCTGSYVSAPMGYGTISYICCK